MPIGESRYSKAELPPNYARALLSAFRHLAYRFADDMALLLRGKDFESTSMSSYLPWSCSPRYTAVFAKKFLDCLLSIETKQKAKGAQYLASVGEELALNAALDYAGVLLDEEGIDAEFGPFEDSAFKNLDFRMLFDPALDGFEGDPEIVSQACLSIFGSRTGSGRSRATIHA